MPTDRVFFRDEKLRDIFPIHCHVNRFRLNHRRVQVNHRDEDSFRDDRRTIQAPSAVSLPSFRHQDGRKPRLVDCGISDDVFDAARKKEIP